MAGTTIESLFGINAGIVWKALNQYGSSNIRNLVKTTSLSREDVYGALGWLGREDKLAVVQKERAIVFSLRDEEASLPVIKEIEEAESASKAKSNRKSKPLKKTKKARKENLPSSKPKA